MRAAKTPNIFDFENFYFENSSINDLKKVELLVSCMVRLIFRQIKMGLLDSLLFSKKNSVKNVLNLVVILLVSV